MNAAIDLDDLEASALAWLEHRAEFKALPEEQRRAPGVPAFWHDARRTHDMLEPEAILELVRLARIGSRTTAE